MTHSTGFSGALVRSGRRRGAGPPQAVRDAASAPEKPAFGGALLPAGRVAMLARCTAASRGAARLTSGQNRPHAMGHFYRDLVLLCHCEAHRAEAIFAIFPYYLRLLRYARNDPNSIKFFR